MVLTDKVFDPESAEWRLFDVCWLKKAGLIGRSVACRGFDPVAPVIHEWTYEAMAYDLLNMKGDIFKYESETQGGACRLLPDKNQHSFACLLLVL